MKKLISLILVLTMFISMTAQAGTISKAISTVTNKIEYITAGELVTSLMIGAKVKPDKPLDYWGKAIQMGLIPGEVKKDKPLTRAQASYIVWKLINNVKELKDKNIPVSYRIVPPTEAFMRGICFYGGPISSEYDYFNMTIKGYDLMDFIQGYQLLILEFKYADGKSEIKYVWDRYKGAEIRIDKESYDASFRRIHQEFKKKYPDKITYAPRPYQKGWLFTIDPVREGDIKYAKLLADRYEDPEYYQDVNKILKDKNYPLTRQDIAVVSYLYHAQQREEFKGYFGVYNIKEHPYFNMYLEDFLINYPRKYPVDYKRFANYCKDYYSIPQVYREPMLYLADLGIITPDQSALYIGVYYFNPAKTLTRAEATTMIARLFDKSKRDVLDEVSVVIGQYWAVKNSVGLGEYTLSWIDPEFKTVKKLSDTFDKNGTGIVFATQQVTIRLEELKAIGLAKASIQAFSSKYVAFSIARQNYMMGEYDLACTAGGYPYDELDAPKVEVWSSDSPQKTLLHYIPTAYKTEFINDFKTYTITKLKSISKSGEIFKKYGDVYVNFQVDPYYKGVIKYKIYTAIPQYVLDNKNAYPILTAKADTKYSQ